MKPSALRLLLNLRKIFDFSSVNHLGLNAHIYIQLLFQLTTLVLDFQQRSLSKKISKFTDERNVKK